MKKEFVLFIILSLCWLGCSKNSDHDAEKYYESLGKGAAMVSYQIENKEFYQKKELFVPEVYISHDMFNLTLSSPNGDRTIINVSGVKWDGGSGVNTPISLTASPAANIKIGKMLDAKQMIGEGYMMTEGQMRSVYFSEEKMIFEIEGKAGKYSDFEQPDKLLQVRGLIVCKHPKVNMTGVSGKEVFGSR